MQMSLFTSQPEFDLLGERPEPVRQRGGVPRHVPTAETMLKVNELRAEGKTQVDIARALGISVNTLARHYFPSKVAHPPMGRRRHHPTSATREVVRRAVERGMIQPTIAKLLGISVPTLRLYYRSELSR